MRKLLLGTSALVAAAGLTTAASAQTSEPIKMRVSGYYTAGIGYTFARSKDPFNNASRDHAFKQDTEVHFLGETKLDNGLIVGVHFELEGQDSTDQIDETWMYFKGSWGELRFGDEDDPRKLKAYVAPVANPDAAFGVNSPFLAFTNAPIIGTNTTTANIENDSTKIIYFTPTIFGFSFAASYTPDGTSHACRAACGNAAGVVGLTGQAAGLGGAGGSNPLLGNAGTSYDWSAAANYDAKFGDFTLGLGAGYTEGTLEVPTVGGASDHVFAARGGGIVGWGPIKFGGSYERVNGTRGVAGGGAATGFGGTGTDSNVFDLGAVYSIGPFAVGAAWSHGGYHNIFGAALGAGAGTDTVSNLDDYMLTVNYALGPGIALTGALEYVYYDSGVQSTAAGSGNNHNTVLILGTRLVF
jgi:outer membrane protein OmpU